MQIQVAGEGTYTFDDAGAALFQAEGASVAAEITGDVPTWADFAANPNTRALRFVDPETNPNDLKVKIHAQQLLKSYGVADESLIDQMVIDLLQNDLKSGLSRRSMDFIRQTELTSSFFKDGYQILYDKMDDCERNIKIGDRSFKMVDQGDSDFCYLAAYILMMQSYYLNENGEFIQNVLSDITPMDYYYLTYNLANNPQQILVDCMDQNGPYYQGMSSTLFLSTLQPLEIIRYSTNDFKSDFLQAYLQNRWLMVHTNNWHGLPDSAPAHFIYILAISFGTEILIVGCNPLGGMVELIDLQYLQDHTDMIYTIPKEVS